MSTPNVSIAICTYNRADMLRQVLEDLTQQELPSSEFTWEVLIIDNNSTDDTQNVARDYSDRLPIRYLSEPQQGVGFARSRALEEFQADLLIYVDDDVRIGPEWLRTFWGATERWPQMEVFHGRVLPIWSCPAPKWLSLDPKILVRAPLPEVDRGDKEEVVGPGLFTPANAALRRSAIERAGKFATDFGPGSGDIIRGEEAYYGRRLEQVGADGVYVPTVVVRHPVDESRLTPAYFRTWSRSMGRARVRFYPMLNNGATRRFGVPPHVPREWLECRLKQFYYWLRRDLPLSFYQRCRAWKLEGMMYEAWFVQPRRPGDKNNPVNGAAQPTS